MNADIICVQETKLTRPQLDRSQALLKDFDAFYSFNRRLPLKGYSGTAIYTRRTACVPLKAEEGITGIVQTDAGSSIPATAHVAGYPQFSTWIELGLGEVDLRDLDIEGRATIVDLGLFVLINLYCPNVTNDERYNYKLAYNAAVEARVRALIKQGRKVMVVGDMNICAQAIDHCDPDKSMRDHQVTSFTDTQPRTWFNRLIGKDGILIDTTRHFHPTRTNMFTCWEQRINAREGNYGTRIDYILVTPDLMPWIANADIQPEIRGSDHCPIFIDLHEEITTNNGQSLSLWSELNGGRSRTDALPDPPRFAARFNPEFHKQNLLSSFFNRPAAALTAPLSVESPEEELSVDAALSRLQSSTDVSDTLVVQAQPLTSTSQAPSLTSRASSVPSQSSSNVKSLSSQPVSTAKRPKLEAKSSSSTSAAKSNTKAKGKGAAKGTGQATLATFFSPPPEIKPKPEAKSKKRKIEKASEEDDSEVTFISSSGPSDAAIRVKNNDGNPPSDVLEAINAVENQAATVEAWSTFFASSKKQPPKCSVHDEPCKRWTVNKPGPNKGRSFWLCARPVGEGFRDKVKNEFRCDHFSWDKAPKR